MPVKADAGEAFGLPMPSAHSMAKPQGRPSGKADFNVALSEEEAVQGYIATFQSETCSTRFAMKHGGAVSGPRVVRPYGN